MKYILMLWIAVLVLAASAIAQPPDTLWTGLYGLSDWGYAYAVRPTLDGGFAIVGSMSNPSRCALVKARSTGERQWFQSLGPLNSCANDVQPMSDGGYLLVGTAGIISAILIRTDSLGHQQWTQSFTDHNPAFVRTAKCSNGDIIVVGTQTDSVISAARYLRITPTGNVLWDRTCAGPQGQRLSLTLDAVCPTADGGFVGAGTADTVDVVIDADFFILRATSDGDTLWTRVIREMDQQGARSVQSTGDGFVIGGIDNLGSVFHPHILKVDGDGNILWNRVITTLGSVGCVAAYEIEQGDLILAGTAYSGAPGSPDYYLARVAPNDTVLWMQRYGGSHTEWAEDMKLTADGGCIIAGRTASFGVQGWDFYAVRTTPVYDPSETKSNFILHPSSLILSCAPNPFNPSTRIEFDLARAERVRLRVYDVLGKEVAVMSDGLLEAGRHSIIFDGTALSSGIYFARLETGKSVRTEKLMLLK